MSCTAPVAPQEACPKIQRSRLRIKVKDKLNTHLRHFAMQHCWPACCWPAAFLRRYPGTSQHVLVLDALLCLPFPALFHRRRAPSLLTLRTEVLATAAPLSAPAAILCNENQQAAQRISRGGRVPSAAALLDDSTPKAAFGAASPASVLILA